ncbi:MAG: BufA1 family periplasmic bufferin-type metallophore [Gammaproteobacteria bacterium]
MKDTKTMVHSAVLGLLALGLSGNSLAEKPAAGEKCYGIGKAGKNDCQTAVSACAGTAKQASDPTAFIYLPKGACEKITGGSVTPQS